MQLHITLNNASQAASIDAYIIFGKVCAIVKRTHKNLVNARTQLSLSQLMQIRESVSAQLNAVVFLGGRDDFARLAYFHIPVSWDSDPKNATGLYVKVETSVGVLELKDGASNAGK